MTAESAEHAEVSAGVLGFSTEGERPGIEAAAYLFFIGRPPVAGGYSSQRGRRISQEKAALGVQFLGALGALGGESS